MHLNCCMEYCNDVIDHQQNKKRRKNQTRIVDFGSNLKQVCHFCSSSHARTKQNEYKASNLLDYCIV